MSEDIMDERDEQFEVADGRPASFYWIDNELPDDDRIDGYDLAIYNIICKCANNSRGNSAFPSQSFIAEKLKFGRTTVNQRLKKLEDLGYITSNFRTNNSGGNTSKIYRLTDAKSVYYSYQSMKKHRDESCVSDTHGDPPVYETNIPCLSDTQGPVCQTHSNKNNNNNNNTNKNKDIYNKPKSKSLFDIPSKPPTTTKNPLDMISHLKGKVKCQTKINYFLEGKLKSDDIDDLDLCFYYASTHKETLGYEIPYQKEFYMATFRDKYNLSMDEALKLVPSILAEFRRICEEEKRKKSDWYLKIGILTFDAPSDIARIMNKVKPKVNEKYITEETPTEINPPGNIVDEVF